MENTAFTLLRYIVKAAVSLIPGGGIVTDLIVDLFPSIAEDVYKNWSEERNAEQMRKDMEALAQAEADEVRAEARQMIREEGAKLPAEVQDQLEDYLEQLPGSLQRTLKRPEDPSGHTVPNRLIPRNAQDVLRFLPGQMPRFKKGQKPDGCGDWVLERLLGAGGFGEVWLARNPYMQHRLAALKFCLDPSAAHQLQREADLLGRVMREGKHPGIVELRNTYLSAAFPCLEYEYVEGGELGGLIREWHSREGGPSPEETARVILRIAEIIAFTHSLNPPIVHRDLKPANILIQPGAQGAHFKIADFGIGGVAAQKAAQETMAGRTKPPEILGKTLHGSHTPLYSSPEQALGAPPAPQDDVHALGVIWYQMLTGDMTKGAPSGDQWKKRLADNRVPNHHIEILVKCIEENRDDRYKNAGNLVLKLKILLQAEGPAPKVAIPTGNQKHRPLDDKAIAILRGDPKPHKSRPLNKRQTSKAISFSPAGNIRGDLGSLGSFTNSLGMTFIPVAGTNVLWCEHQTRVKDYAAYAAANPGVRMEWKDVEYKAGFFCRSHKQNGDHPVVNVSWEDAKGFCAWLSQKEDRVYRLPTDHEWSVAVGIGHLEDPQASPKAKSGKVTGYPWGDAWPPPAGYGNYAGSESASGNSIKGYRDQHPFTAPVKSYRATNGLYDLSGNVWEWCEDWYSSEQKDHVLRGGSWCDNAAFNLRSSDRFTVRSSFPNRDLPTSRGVSVGFRCVVSPAR